MMPAPAALLAYVELPAADVAVARAFYEGAFGYDFTDYGPTYAGSTSGGTELGLISEGAPPAPMPGLKVKDLEAARARVTAAGGEIVKDIFAFPGGRRFEFIDPAGNRLAVFVYEE